MSRPSAVLVDVDGTIAVAHGRSPYDESTVSADLPNNDIIAVVRALYRDGHQLIVVSERAVGDRRPDVVVKKELYRRHIEPRYRVLCVLENRSRVVEMWRGLGLTCLQVAPGDF